MAQVILFIVYNFLLLLICIPCEPNRKAHWHFFFKKMFSKFKGFHDCVGGCNGCINFNNSDNNGLAPAVNTLTQIYKSNNFKSFNVSLADFFALAATVGVTAAVQSSNQARNGGITCKPNSCPGP
jgi:hypothetical protein